MKMATVWRAGSASDPGLERSINEDRVFVDDARGLFMVVDGLGGHAAGETAAATAVEVIEKELRGARSIDEVAIRKAITAANNQIYALSAANAAWRGMACVLTLAVASGDRFLIGHVGDSRLYLFWNGALTKITSDHSPVGELEDSGQLTEEQAMHHPRRNEVFRDVGSYPHLESDAELIETKSIQFPSDGALLLCSDGLTDLVKASDITRVLEKYDGDAARIANLLVDAANAAGGRDNISVVFVPGPAFLGSESATSAEGRNRHATTRMRKENANTRSFFRNLLLLAVGGALGLGGWQAYQHYVNKTAEPVVAPAPAPHIPREILVDASNANGIISALAEALPGDTITIPPGEYLGPLVLKDRVNLAGQSERRVIVRSNPAVTTDAGIGIVAQGVKEGHIKGIHIEGTDTHPLRTGLLINDSSIEAEDLEVTGAIESGIHIEGDSHPLVIGSSFHANAGPGVVVRGLSTPRFVDNRIADNGRVPGALHAGIEISNEAQPTLSHNEILHNGLAPVFPLALDEEIHSKNTFDAAPAGKPGVKRHVPAVPPATTTKPDAKPNAIGHPSKPLTEA